MKSNGFTLIELITVMVLIGVLAAVAAPRFFSGSDFEHRFFYDDLVHAARYARHFAVSKGCYTRLNVTSTQYALQRDSDCNHGTLSFTVTLRHPEDQEPYLNTGAPAGTATTQVVFDSQGRAGSVSGNVFTPYSSTRTFTVGSRSVRVDGDTGFVR